MAVYPSQFPCADRVPYSVGVDAGVLRTPFANGFARQRRSYFNMPHTFGLQFTLLATELAAWQQWVNENAWIWFQIDLQSGLGGGAIRAPHEIRFISSLEISSQGWNLVSVTVAAEASQAMLLGEFVPVLPPPVTIVNLPNTSVNIDNPFSFIPIVTGGVLPLSFSIIGKPSGWTFNPATGALLSPNLPVGIFGPMTITVTDSDGQTDSVGPFSVQTFPVQPWIVGRYPGSPAPQGMAGGSPDFPSVDVTIPGTPSNPTVVVRELPL